MNEIEFRHYVEEAFVALAARYRLQPLPPSTDEFPNPFEVRFANSTTLVVVQGIHYGFGVDVRLASVSSADMKFPTYDFGDLLELRAPEFKRIVAGPTDTRDIQRRQVDSFVAALPIHADDVLRGDFTRFPLLARAIQDRKGSLRRRSTRFKRSSSCCRDPSRRIGRTKTLVEVLEERRAGGS
jgi:hypothetical protein